MGSKPTRQEINFETEAWSASRRLSNSAGQSGDTQGLFDTDDADSETVEELLEDGQYFEAEAIRAIENVPPADLAEVRTRQLAEDDIPVEYLR